MLVRRHCIKDDDGTEESGYGKQKKNGDVSGNGTRWPATDIKQATEGPFCDRFCK